MKEERLAIARALMDRYGLHDWSVDFADLSRTPTKTLTGASYGARGICVFFSNQILIDSSLVGHRNKFRQTLLHEVAHALLGRPGHDATWRRIAKRVGCSRKAVEVYKSF